MMYPYSNTDKKSIIVFGEGRVTVEPDIAIVTLGVTTEDVEIKKAQDENQNIIDNIVKNLEQIGIERENIKTIQYNVYPQYDFIDNVKTFKNFKVDHILEIKVEDIEQANEVIDTSVENGANILRGVRFEVEDTKEYYNDALELAVINGKNKAEEIAIASDVQINIRPIKVVEKSTSDQVIVSTPSTKAVEGIYPGTTNINAILEITFEII